MKTNIYTMAFWIIIFLLIFGFWKFIASPIIDKMSCIDLSEDEREFYTDTWPPQ